ncbi:GPI transamidase component [Sporothrix bragantina]|uniref:GPI transamidase component n=1 Tax=Sporothrix bragantina TaxID=671064 RepID=A0ABP0BG05_9PEZI
MAPRKPADAAAVTVAKGANASTEAASPPSPTSKPDDAASPTAQKQPPPEKPSEVRRRGAVILSFWLIVGLLGLPIWWYTTTIYRANLPLDDMMEWADGKACRPVFPLRISIQAASLQEAEANHLLRLTQHALDDLNDFSGHHLRLELPPSSDSESTSSVASSSGGGPHREDVALTIRLTPGDAATASLHPSQSILDVTYPPNSIPSLSSSTSTLATFVATQLRSTFAEEQAVISYLLSTSSASPAEQQWPRSLAPEVADALARRTTRSVKYAPTYHITFSLFTSGPAPSSWDIEGAIAEYMEPILDVLGPIHNFTIDTQVQLYATPGVQSAVLSKQDLSSFINAAEWPLSPSIGGAPTINFIVFAGNQTINTAPTVELQQQKHDQQEPKEGEPVDGGNGEEATPKENEVAPGTGSTSQSWLIPQWGAVYLLSAGNGADAHVSREDLREPMLTFTSHLLSLLGTPQSGSLPLRLSTLSRIRSADLLLRASSTLGSLARLSLALRNIAIPSSVAEGVESTMHHLRLACDSLGGPEGLANARIAEAEAEKAFFEKSMVGQLYFPDEHKVAVYLPLLGPVGVPLVMGLLNELRSWMRRRKERAAAAESEKKKQ